MVIPIKQWLAAPVCFVLAACASTPAYQLVVPLARSEVLGDVHLGDQQFEIRYQLDAAGQHKVHTVSSTGSYTGSDQESFETIKNVALQRMIRNAVDDVNGVFIMAKTEVHQQSATRGQVSSSYQDFKDDTISKLMGFAKLEGHPQCQREVLAGDATRVECTGQVKVPLVDVVRTRF